MTDVILVNDDEEKCSCNGTSNGPHQIRQPFLTTGDLKGSSASISSSIRRQNDDDDGGDGEGGDGGGSIDHVDTSIHKPTSKLATFANLVKANIGTGVLSLPYAMKNAGLAVGTIGLVLVGFLCIFNMHQLLGVYRKVLRNRGGRHPERRLHLDYADVAELAFSDAKSRRLRQLAVSARWTVNVFLIFTQIGACCIYLNFCSTMVKRVAESQFDAPVLNVRVYQSAVTVLLLMYCCVRTLHILAIFSTIANLLTIGSLCVVMQHVVRHLQPHDQLPLYTNPSDFFMFFGTIMFAYESVTFVLPFESKMKDRGSFHFWDGLMSLSMVVVVVIYTAVAFYSYLAYGVEAQFILKSVPDNLLFNIIRLIYAICIFLSYNLQLFIPIQILWPPIMRASHQLLSKKWHRHFRQNGEYVVRAIFVLLSFALSAFVPCLEEMIALVGSLVISSLALVFPSILEIVTYLPGWGERKVDEKANAIELHSNGTKPLQTDQTASQGTKKPPPSTTEVTLVVLRDIGIVLLGIAASFAGTYIAIRDIMAALENKLCS